MCIISWRLEFATTMPSSSDTSDGVVRISLGATAGIGRFRSSLEQRVANELTALAVEWEYEKYPQMPSGQRINYLPDFFISSAKPELRLPRWIECKPQDFLYRLRVFCEIDRRFGEYFENPIAVEDCDHTLLAINGFTELSKPKKLAEWLNEPVLVIGAVGGTKTLSLEMRPSEIVFERFHPFVNQAGVKKAQEKIEREKRYEAQRLQYQQEQRLRRSNLLSYALQGKKCGVNKRPSTCCGCDTWLPAGHGSLRLNEGRWFVVCHQCRS